MSIKDAEQKKGFWQRNKFFIIGLLGVLLFLSFFSVRSVVLSYKVGEEAYTVKMEYTMFNFCINCMSATENAAEIIEKDVFTFTGEEESVRRAAKALKEIAGGKEGEFIVAGSKEENNQEVVEYLKSLGYQASIAE